MSVIPMDLLWKSPANYTSLARCRPQLFTTNQVTPYCYSVNSKLVNPPQSEFKTNLLNGTILMQSFIYFAKPEGCILRQGCSSRKSHPCFTVVGETPSTPLKCENFAKGFLISHIPIYVEGHCNYKPRFKFLRRDSSPTSKYQFQFIKKMTRDCPQIIKQCSSMT